MRLYNFFVLIIEKMSIVYRFLWYSILRDSKIPSDGGMASDDGGGVDEFTGVGSSDSDFNSPRTDLGLDFQMEISVGPPLLNPIPTPKDFNETLVGV